MKRNLRRVLAMLCTVALVTGASPLTILAAEIEEAVGVNEQEEGMALSEDPLKEDIERETEAVSTAPLNDGEYPWSGECGKEGSSVHWAVSGSNDDLTLTISGKGEMEDEKYTGGPWGEKYIGYKIKHLIISDGITSIGGYAFYNCEGLEDVSFSSSLKSIGDYAFWSCAKLNEVTLPSGLEWIGNAAFGNCSGLQSIILPATLKSIGISTEGYQSTIFGGCSRLEDISVEQGSQFFSSEDGVLFDREKTILYRYPEGKTDTTYNLPSTVETLFNGAFWGARNLTSFPSGASNLRVIHYNAFSHCKFDDITIPDTVEVLGQSDNLYEVTSLHLPSNLKVLCDYLYNKYDNNYNYCSLPIDSVNSFSIELDDSK